VNYLKDRIIVWEEAFKKQVDEAMKASIEEYEKGLSSTPPTVLKNGT
jgi:hypothetical protein